MSAKKRLWITGIVLVAIGLILARLIPLQIDSSGIRFAFYAAGALVAVGRLAVIMSAIRK